MHKDGLGISYSDVLMMRDFWVVNDLKYSLNCPFELAEGKPPITIVDNDDFKSDTLTGAGQPHRTNVMFVQPVSLDMEMSSEYHEDRPVPTTKLASSLSISLKQLGCEMQDVIPLQDSEAWRATHQKNCTAKISDNFSRNIHSEDTWHDP